MNVSPKVVLFDTRGASPGPEFLNVGSVVKDLDRSCKRESDINIGVLIRYENDDDGRPLTAVVQPPPPNAGDEPGEPWNANPSRLEDLTGWSRRIGALGREVHS